MDHIDIFQKPSLRGKGKRRGIRTGNTIKYNVNYLRREHNIGVIVRYNNPRNENSENKNSPFEQGVAYSLDKAKRWELIKELKKSDKCIVNEFRYHRRLKKDNRSITDLRYWDYATSSSESEDDEENLDYVITKRKGRKIPKRKPGKKGVVQSKSRKKSGTKDKRVTREAEDLYDVELPLQSKKYPMYHSDDAGYVSPDWIKGIEKNHEHRRKKRLKDSVKTIIQQYGIS
jgi:hypothetical protein